MIIGHDGRYIGGQRGGSEVFLNNVLLFLSEIDRVNQHILYLMPGQTFEDVEGKRNFVQKQMPPLHNSAIARILLSYPFELKKNPVDIFHAHYHSPLYVPAKLVLTLHDFSWVLFPRLFPLKHRTLHNVSLRMAVKKADKIVTGTYFMKKELCRHLNVGEDKIEVVPLGYHPGYFDPVDREQIDATLKKYSISGRYILTVGVLFERKNIFRLIEAFDLLKERTQSPLTLVVAGRVIKQVSEEILKRIDNSKFRSSIVVTDYIEDEEVIHLYQGASVFVFPSLYEGFGLPILEAMASRVPVALSRIPVHQEVAGDAVIYFDPNDAEDMAEKIGLVLGEKDLAEDLVQRGLGRVQQYTWEETAKGLLSVYESLV